ncbi:hypothetical protein Ccrd_011444, partial [Cynara cardunculus var. scolymus]
MLFRTKIPKKYARYVAIEIPKIPTRIPGTIKEPQPLATAIPDAVSKYHNKMHCYLNKSKPEDARRHVDNVPYAPTRTQYSKKYLFPHQNKPNANNTIKYNAQITLSAATPAATTDGETPSASDTATDELNEQLKEKLDYQRPKEPVAKRAVHMPHWSSGDTRGNFKLDLATTTRRLKLKLKVGVFCDDEKRDVSTMGYLKLKPTNVCNICGKRTMEAEMTMHKPSPSATPTTPLM